MTQPSSPVILLAAIIGTGNEPPHQRVSKGHTGEAIGDTQKEDFFLFLFAAEMFFK
jgi:hypothetical protein